MKEYVSIPDSGRETPEQASEWVEKALDHIAAMSRSDQMSIVRRFAPNRVASSTQAAFRP